MKINLISSHVKISSSPNKSLNEPKYSFFMIEISWKIARKYSATLGNLLIYSAIFGKCSNCSNERRKAFGEFLKIFGNLRKMFGNLREVAKMSLILFFLIYIMNRTIHIHLWIQYLSCRVQHSKKKFVSTRGHVISSTCCLSQ